MYTILCIFFMYFWDKSGLPLTRTMRYRTRRQESFKTLSGLDDISLKDCPISTEGRNTSFLCSPIVPLFQTILSTVTDFYPRKNKLPQKPKNTFAFSKTLKVPLAEFLCTIRNKPRIVLRTGQKYT